MSTLERTREIGVLRALGWRRSAILGLIMREALVLGFLGALAGMALSVFYPALRATRMQPVEALRYEWKGNYFQVVVGQFLEMLRFENQSKLEELSDILKWGRDGFYQSKCYPHCIEQSQIREGCCPV